MVKNILLFVSIMIAGLSFFEAKQSNETFNYILSKQRNEIENLQYQFNQCKILYRGM